MKKIALISHGCAKNLVDSELILGFLKQAGFEITLNDKETDLVIVNTCSFISDAEREGFVFYAGFVSPCFTRRNIAVNGVPLCVRNADIFPRRLFADGDVGAYLSRMCCLYLHGYTVKLALIGIFRTYLQSGQHFLRCQKRFVRNGGKRDTFTGKRCGGTQQGENYN